MAGKTVNYYSDEEQADRLSDLQNKSEFIRRAVDAALSAQSESERRLSEIDDEVDYIDKQIRDLKQERSELVREREELEALTGASKSAEESQDKQLNIVVETVEEMLTRPADTQIRYLKKNLNDDLATAIDEDVVLHTIDNADANAVSGEMVLDDLRDEGFDTNEVVTAEHNDVYSLTDDAFEIVAGVTSRERSEIEELLN
jgi:chromosome segregation ATPase